MKRKQPNILKVSEQEIENRLEILKQQLSLITKYKNHFEEVLGRVGVSDFVDTILDEIIYLEKERKNLKRK